jgi:transcriptional regulator with XRE-family HTH domain
MPDEAEPAGKSRSPFGRLLRELRVAANLSQETLAERAGASVSGFSALNVGHAVLRTAIPPLCRFARIRTRCLGADRARLETPR